MAEGRGSPEREGLVARLLREDALSGLMFMAIAAFGLWIGQDYPVGTATRMGPGYIPRGLCWILLSLGALVFLSGLRGPRVAAAEGPPPFLLRPLVLIPLSVVAFALTLDWLGLAVATGLLILIAAFADRGQRPLEIAGTLIVLLFLTIAVFVWGVGIPLKLWPEL